LNARRIQIREKIRAIQAAIDKPFHFYFLVLSHDVHVKTCIEEQAPIVSFHYGVPSAENIASLSDVVFS